MSVRRTLLLIVLVSLALAVALIWHRTSAPASMAQAAHAASAPPTTSHAPNPRASAQLAASQGTSGAAAKAQSFESLKQRAKAGDAVAQRLLADAYEACFVVNLDRQHLLRIHQRIKQEKPEQADLLEHTMQQRIAQCDAVDGGAIIPRELIDGWYAQAAANGDLPARIMDYAHSGTPLDADTATRLFEEVVASGDPAAMYSLGSALGSGFVENLREPYRSLAADPMAGEAWSVAACRLGYPCGPDSTDMGNYCLLVGRCLGETAEELVFAVAKSDAERAALERKVQQIVDAVSP